MSISAFSFPLRNKKAGDQVDYTGFLVKEGDISKFINEKNYKLIFLWRYDKPFSKKIYNDFIKICKDRAILCLSVELSGENMEEISKLGEGANIILATADKKMAAEWGVFTLPVTVFVDENNKIINAIGYEGQYLYKVEKYIDMLKNGKAGNEYNKNAEIAKIDDTTGDITFINFAIKMIKNGDVEKAKASLEKVNKGKLNSNERVRLAEAYTLLKEYKVALNLLSGVDTPSAKFLMAYVNYLKGEVDKAFELINEIKNIYPDKKKINLLLGKICLQKGDYKNAATYFSYCINEESMID